MSKVLIFLLPFFACFSKTIQIELEKKSRQGKFYKRVILYHSKNCSAEFEKEKINYDKESCQKINNLFEQIFQKEVTIEAKTSHGRAVTIKYIEADKEYRINLNKSVQNLELKRLSSKLVYSILKKD